MTWEYAYTPNVWLPLGAIALVALMGLFSWRHRNMPGVKPFIILTLFACLWLVGVACGVVAITPETIIAWYKFQVAMQVPTVTAGTCFVLEYVFPGRWLTRRNLGLLALPPLLFLLMIVTNDSQLVWQRLEIVSDGSVVPYLALPGMIMLVYAFSLVLVNAVIFIWLFIRSPQHRWPVALMLIGQFGARAGYLLDTARLPLQSPLNPLVTAILLPWATYSIALFGFRIFDPLPTARRMVIEQMRVGAVVFDAGWRVLSLNPAAERMLGVRVALARGKTWQQLAPSKAPLPTLTSTRDGHDSAASAVVEGPEMTFGPVPNARQYMPALSPLLDYRGIVVGHLLMLHDVTEQRRAQAQVIEQQRTLAVLQERDRLARELHDSLGQTLAAAHLQVKSAKLLLARGETAQTDDCLERLTEMTVSAEADVREYLLGAKTAFATGQSFFTALRQYVVKFSQQYGLRVELSVPPELEARGLGSTAEMQLLRIIQEALSNVRKHARASSAQVVFSVAGPLACITIQDDGQGFDTAAVRQAEGFGLQAMSERAEALGGYLELISRPGEGTQVVVQVPVGDGDGRGDGRVRQWMETEVTR